MNPATLQFYPPIIEISPPLPSHQSYTILHPADSPSTPPTTLPMNYTANSATDEWSKKDFKFASLLPKNWLLKRNIYRKLIAETLPKLLELDGVELGRRERRRLRNLEGWVCREEDEGLGIVYLGLMILRCSCKMLKLVGNHWANPNYFGNLVSFWRLKDRKRKTGLRQEKRKIALSVPGKWRIENY